MENDQGITERAAIVVVALLVHELEGVTLLEVLQVGSGGDYAGAYRRGRVRLQVEVSGIRADLTGEVMRSRLAEKRAQVLTRSTRGYASVTTFQWTGGDTVHSYLHYVESSAPTIPGGKRKPGKGKKS
jgi:hypothetical protein